VGAIKLSIEHPWDVTPEDAVLLQQELALKVTFSPLPDTSIWTVAGVDVGYRQPQKATTAVAVFDYSEMRMVDQGIAVTPVSFPYIPGLLSFREMPAILAALEKLKSLPDLILVDGHGYAHPRRFGLACHLGVVLDKPAIGCGKSILVGECGSPDETRGGVANLVDNREILGVCVRTRSKVKPVYLSVGHRVDIKSAVRIILNTSSGYRLPEPLRQAHRLASQ
jgi:deoxyribonuclease V